MNLIRLGLLARRVSKRQPHNISHFRAYLLLLTRHLRVRYPLANRHSSIVLLPINRAKLGIISPTRHHRSSHNPSHHINPIRLLLQPIHQQINSNLDSRSSPLHPTHPTRSTARQVFRSRRGTLPVTHHLQASPLAHIRIPRPVIPPKIPMRDQHTIRTPGVLFLHHLQGLLLASLLPTLPIRHNNKLNLLIMLHRHRSTLLHPRHKARVRIKRLTTHPRQLRQLITPHIRARRLTTHLHPGRKHPIPVPGVWEISPTKVSVVLRHVASAKIS